MVMLTKKSTATKKRKKKRKRGTCWDLVHTLGPEGEKGELNCKYGLATDISEILLLKSLGVYDKFLHLFEYK